MMRIDVVTIFPEAFPGFLGCSLLGRARERGVAEVVVHDLRRWTTDRHHVVDDAPYGGGPGMVMKPEPFFAAADELRGAESVRIILTSPQGRLLDHELVEELAAEDRFIILCGHYEGVDERVREGLVTDEVSIGDYVLTGGELPALVLVDAVVRLQPGVLGSVASVDEDSFAEGLLKYPQYTRPAEFRGLQVPEVLLTGHHAEVRRWRRREALARTLQRRPELLAEAGLSEEDEQILEELRRAAPPAAAGDRAK